MKNIERLLWALLGGVILTSGLYLIRVAAQAAHDWHRCAEQSK